MISVHVSVRAYVGVCNKKNGKGGWEMGGGVGERLEGGGGDTISSKRKSDKLQVGDVRT